MRPTITTTDDRAAITCGTTIITGLVVYAPAWTDDTTPRTDAPVRFLPRMTLAGQYPGERPFYPSAVRPLPLPPR